VPSVKSLLVRARISLAEAAEARKLSCAEVRLELGEVAEGLTKLSVPARRHVRGCERCRFFRKQLKHNNHALAAMLPVGPLLLVKKLLLTKLGSTASAGSAHVAGSAGATVGAGAGAAAGAGATGGASVAGILTAGTGALATKAVAGLAAAAIVTAGAVAADHVVQYHKRLSPATSASAPVLRYPSEPVVVSERAQPLSSATAKLAASAIATHHSSQPQVTKTAKPAPGPGAGDPATVPTARVGSVAPAAKPIEPKPAAMQVAQVTTETTQLPAAATEPDSPTAPASQDLTSSSTPPPPPPPSVPTSREPESAPSAPPPPSELAPPPSAPPPTTPSTEPTPPPASSPTPPQAQDNPGQGSPDQASSN
jgi:hypothetical protein